MATDKSISRRWNITVFAEPGAWDPLGVLRAKQAEFGYACWGYEAAPSSGRRHWHVYIRFISRKRLSTVKLFLGVDDAHCELCEGNEKQNKDYCWKDNTDTGELGEFKANEGKAGKRSDLEAIAMEVDAGATDRDIAGAHQSDYIRYHQGIAAYRLARKVVPLQRDLTILLLWGPTGSGKTHRILTTFPDIYQVVPGRDPWGQYQGEQTIVFDEWNPSLWTVQAMNQYLDKWKVELTARYYNRYAEWTRVVICANSPPTTFYQEMFASAPMLVDAFRRRITGACHLVEAREDQGGPTIEQLIESPPNPF